MQEIDILERDWRVTGLGHPLHRAMTFTQEGLVLGRGTLLAAFPKYGRGKGWRGTSHLLLDGQEARVLSLLTAAHGKPIINFSFSANAEDYIHRFMKVAERTSPKASLVPIIAWYIGGTFTTKVTQEVKKYGPGIGVGAIDQKDLTDELVVPIGGLKVAIRLPEELQSADRLAFDYVDGSFVVVAN